MLSTSLLAIPKGPCDIIEDVCCESYDNDPYAFTYPKDVGLPCPSDFYVHGEFLYFRSVEEGLDYILTQDTYTTYPVFPASGSINGFSINSKEWHWNPGFRVGFGFYTMTDAWNFDTNWTYIRMKGTANTSNDGDGELYALNLPVQSETELPPVDIPYSLATWNGDLNTLDLMMGKPYHISRYFVSNPMFGLRTAWIDQNYHVRYYLENVKRNVTLKNSYWGVGLRGLYEGNFLLGSGCMLYGKGAFSLMYGKFHIDQISDAYPTTYEYQVSNNSYKVNSNIELSIGFKWSKFFNKGQYLAGINIGYEFHHWWNQNKLRKFYNLNPVSTDTVSRGNLSFNGLIAGLNIDF